MASLNQVISEIAHSINQADNVPVRESIKLSIIQAREKLIRQSYNNNRHIDKNFIYSVELTMKHTPSFTHNGFWSIRIPKLIRLGNEAMLISIRFSNQDKSSKSIILSEPIPSINSGYNKYYKNLPGFNNKVMYEYIENYFTGNIYWVGNYTEINNSAILTFHGEDFKQTTVSGHEGYKNVIPRTIILQFIPKYPNNFGNCNIIMDDDGYYDEKQEKKLIDAFNINKNLDDYKYIPEDMILDIKKLVLETLNPPIIRDTNEPNPINIVK